MQVTETLNSGLKREIKVTVPAGDMEAKLVARLSEVYRRHLIPITNLIHSKPRRIREFAEAFKLRKDR